MRRLLSRRSRKPRSRLKRNHQPVPALVAGGMGPDLHWFPEDVSAQALAETLAALANSEGGQVLVGISPRAGRVQGLSDSEAVLDVVFQAALLADPPLILPLPVVEDVEGRDVVRVVVPAGLPHIFTVGGRYLGRDGRHTAPMAPGLLRRKLVERGVVQFEARIPPGATLADLDEALVDGYAQRIQRSRDEDPHRLLLRRGCLAMDGQSLLPTLAGLLLFGKEPQRWAPNALVLAARFSGPAISDAFLKQEIAGPLPQQLNQAEAFFRENIRSVVHLNGLTRDDRPEYPLEAVRELLVNAVAHRDYSIQGDSIHLHIFSNRLEVHSPGTLPGPVNLRNLLEARFSRNPTIVQVLSDFGYIERLGYGLDRVVRVMREARLQPPAFQEVGGTFRVALSNLSLPEETVPVIAAPVEIYRMLGLNARQETAIAYMADHGRISNSDYQELCPEVHAETLRRDLADLVKKHVLLKIGSKRGTYYIFKSQDHP